MKSHNGLQPLTLARTQRKFGLNTPASKLEIIGAISPFDGTLYKAYVRMRDGGSVYYFEALAHNRLRGLKPGVWDSVKATYSGVEHFHGTGKALLARGLKAATSAPEVAILLAFLRGGLHV